MFGGEALSVRPIVSPLRSDGEIEASLLGLIVSWVGGLVLQSDGFMHRKADRRCGLIFADLENFRCPRGSAFEATRKTFAHAEPFRIWTRSGLL